MSKPRGKADWDTVCAGTRKTPPRREKAGGRGKASCSPGRQRHATHEPLISRAMREEAPFAGLCSTIVSGGVVCLLAGGDIEARILTFRQGYSASPWAA